MNILYYWLDYQTNMENWQRIHIFDELERSGYFIEVFNPLNFESFDSANDELIKHIRCKKIKPDLFLTCVSSEYLYNDTILRIRNESIPTLLICFDNLHAPYMHKKNAALFDLVWLTSKETEYLFKSWGCKTIFMPYASNPNQFYPIKGQEIASLGFVGTLYGVRSEKIKIFADNMIDCNIYSSSKVNSQNQYNNNTINILFQLATFPIGRKIIKGAIIKKLFYNRDINLGGISNLHYFPSPSFEEMNRLYSNLSISLNLIELRNTHVLRRPLHKLHLRTFEIPMAGGLQFTSYNDELADYFEENNEIVFYNTDDEMVEKARFLLRADNEKIRQKIKLNARLRALGDHTWMNRFNRLFTKLFE